MNRWHCWYYVNADSNAEVGPLSGNELQQAVLDGHIADDTLVRSEANGRLKAIGPKPASRIEITYEALQAHQSGISLSQWRLRQFAKRTVYFLLVVVPIAFVSQAIREATRDDVYDIAFPGNMTPDVDFITLHGKSAQIVYGIRIAKNTPIMMLKLVHFSTTMPLGVQEITATSGTHTAAHKFPPNMISRQTVSGGTLEFATLLSYVEDSAGRFLKVISDSDAYNVEVKGANGFTTFSPGKTAREHASQMLVLFSALEQRPDFVATLQRNALSFVEFQKALLQSQ